MEAVITRLIIFIIAVIVATSVATLMYQYYTSLISIKHVELNYLKVYSSGDAEISLTNSGTVDVTRIDVYLSPPDKWFNDVSFSPKPLHGGKTTLFSVTLSTTLSVGQEVRYIVKIYYADGTQENLRGYTIVLRG